MFVNEYELKKIYEYRRIEYEEKQRYTWNNPIFLINDIKRK